MNHEPNSNKTFFASFDTNTNYVIHFLRLRLSLCARAQIIELSELDLGEFQTSKFYENNWDVIIKTELEFGVDDESKT